MEEFNWSMEFKLPDETIQRIKTKAHKISKKALNKIKIECKDESERIQQVNQIIDTMSKWKELSENK